MFGLNTACNFIKFEKKLFKLTGKFFKTDLKSKIMVISTKSYFLKLLKEHSQASDNSQVKAL